MFEDIRSGFHFDLSGLHEQYIYLLIVVGVLLYI